MLKQGENYYLKGRNSMKKIITIITIAFLLFMSLTLVSCSEVDSIDTNSTIGYLTTPSGYLLNPGIPCEIEGYLAYIVIDYNGELLSVIDEAETLVKNWWNDDETFSRPAIIWCNIFEGNIRGFQDEGYIFLDPNTTREDLLATVVHEWLHDLVGKDTLIASDGFGRPLMEMVVEAITVDILDGVVKVDPTSNYLYFEQNSDLYEHKQELISAFRKSRKFEAYDQIFGEDYMRILVEVQVAFEG